MNDIAIPIISMKKALEYIRDACINNGVPCNEYEARREFFQCFMKALGTSQFKVMDRFFVNLPAIRRIAFLHGFEFEKLVALTINHENLHLIIYETDGEEACVKLDNIALKMRMEGYII